MNVENAPQIRQFLVRDPAFCVELTSHDLSLLKSTHVARCWLVVHAPSRRVISDSQQTGAETNPLRLLLNAFAGRCVTTLWARYRATSRRRVLCWRWLVGNSGHDRVVVDCEVQVG